MPDSIFNQLAEILVGFVAEYATVAIPVVLWSLVNLACSLIDSQLRQASGTGAPVWKRILWQAIHIGAMNVKHALNDDDQISKARRSKKGQQIRKIAEGEGT